MVTWRALLAEGAEALRDAGVATPMTDARRLLAHAAGIEAAGLLARLPEEAPPELPTAFRQLLARRIRREPVAQIVGWREFWGRRFRVTRDVLDPRPETELVVELALSAPFRKVLDLGTGSGCILLTLLAERPEAEGIGVDVSPAALAVARENARHLGLAGRVELALGSWWEPVVGEHELIVANPPYVREEDWAGLAPETRDHEPRLALTPGPTGLEAYREIAAGLGRHLAPGGRALFEIGADQGPAVREILALAGFPGAVIHRDLDGRPRVVEIARK